MSDKHNERQCYAWPLNAPNVAYNFTKVVDERPDYVGTGEPVCFMEYGGFCISGVLIVNKH